MNASEQLSEQDVMENTDALRVMLARRVSELEANITAVGAAIDAAIETIVKQRALLSRVRNVLVTTDADYMPITSDEKTTLIAAIDAPLATTAEGDSGGKP